MSSLAHSQSGSHTFPRRIVIDGDSVVAISQQQMTYLLRAHITWVECEEVKDTVLQALDKCQQSFALHDSIVHAKDSIIGLQTQSIAERSSLIATQDAAIREKNQLIEKVTKGRNTWRVLGISGWGAIVITVILVLL